VETCPHLHRTIEQIRQTGARPGVTLNPATSLVTLEEVLGQVDLVLVMSVVPGFGGQDLIPASLERVRGLRRMLDERGLTCPIEIDGGVNGSTVADVVCAGADVLVVGSAIFCDQEGVAAAMGHLRAILESLPAHSKR